MLHANPGYKEKGNINTPLELAICNEVDRFSLAIDRVPGLLVVGAHVRAALRDRQIECRQYAYEHGVDMPEYRDWRWAGIDAGSASARAVPASTEPARTPA